MLRIARNIALFSLRLKGPAEQRKAQKKGESLVEQARI